MDGLSAAASGIAVVSLAIQLAESVKKLHSFWESVKDAPKHFCAIQTDLRLLSTILEKIDREEDLSDPYIRDVLKNCEGQVASLVATVSDIVPGFKAESRRTRAWTSLKAAFKKEKVGEFKSCLRETMSTLRLALMMASHTSHNTQHQALKKEIETLQLQQTLQLHQTTQTVTTLSKISDDLNNHKLEILAAVHQMMPGSSNPVYRHGVEFGLKQAFEQISSVTMSEVDAGIKWATNSERLEDEIRNLGWRAKYKLLCENCWSLSQQEVEQALEDARESEGRIEEIDSEDSSTESDAKSEELSSDYDSPFLLSFG
ncbi:hypothetical protein VE04_06667 [Pseudogymnoascus sp. 24MN13]|nr:hypothetical protein VE04_06667 [Pseudogymnoascus sp. 24MN13]